MTLPDNAGAALAAVVAAARPDRSGVVARYIPELATVDPEPLAVAVADRHGRVIAAGDADRPFAIESISKLFNLCLVADALGVDTVIAKVGSYDTGLPFNSELAINVRTTPLENPVVNAGALATVSLVPGPDPWARMAATLAAFAGAPLTVDQALYDSEMATNDHNRGLIARLRDFGLFYGDDDATLADYTRACSALVTTRQLAVMGACLANGGVHPATGVRVARADTVQFTLTVMTIAGLYENTGLWLARVGLPAKSGVGGGLLAVVPNRFAIAAWSPRLDPAGNSVRAVHMITDLAARWDLHMFRPGP